MIRVLVVDDSAAARRLLAARLEGFDDIDVIDTAADAFEARTKIIGLDPDVVTLDLDMPGIDGLTFLDKLMRYYPKPVVVVSALARHDESVAVRALSLGAIDVFAKPVGRAAFAALVVELAEAIRRAARSRVTRRAPSRLEAEIEGSIKQARAVHPVVPKVRASTPRAEVSADQGVLSGSLIAIGASTGGTRAIEALLAQLPARVPPIVIVQHMPPKFTASFARRLDESCPQRVREARDGDLLEPGLALIAPGGLHMELGHPVGGKLPRIVLHEGPKEHFQRPAVDVLFRSVAARYGARGLGVLMTGMGADGATGLLAMRAAGAHTIAQDQESCVVFGMPREAIRIGAAVEVAALDKIGARIAAAPLFRADRAAAPAG